MSIAIDCGANLGSVTKQLVEKYDTVWAFEPNRYAFSRLYKRFSTVENVRLINAAIVPPNKPSIARIYFDYRSEGDLATKAKYSQATSIFEEKLNVSKDKFDDVLAVNFTEFVKGLGFVDYIKMDVEGAEYEIVSDLIINGLMDKIGQLDVELHGIKYECFKEAHNKLIDLIIGYDIKNIGSHY